MIFYIKTMGLSFITDVSYWTYQRIMTFSIIAPYKYSYLLTYIVQHYDSERVCRGACS